MYSISYVLGQRHVTKCFVKRATDLENYLVSKYISKQETSFKKMIVDGEYMWTNYLELGPKIIWSMFGVILMGGGGTAGEKLRNRTTVKYLFMA